MAELSITLLRAAVDGDGHALREAVEALTPILQQSAARALLRRRAASGHRDIQQEVEDLVQEVFLALFADGGRALLEWDPARGRALESYVGLLAAREVASILRSKRRSPWTDEPIPAEVMDSHGSEVELERHVASREMLSRVLAHLDAHLTPRGLDLFEWLVIEGRPVAEVCELTGMTTEAVYAWRSRLCRMVRKLVADLASGHPE